VGFCAIVLVAAALELFSRALIYGGIIGKNGVAYWLLRIGELVLGAIDLALLLGTVGKQSWRLWKAVRDGDTGDQSSPNVLRAFRAHGRKGLPGGKPRPKSCSGVLQRDAHRITSFYAFGYSVHSAG
jgi:hypothetical protein